MDKEAEEDEPRGHAVQKTVNAVLAVLSVVLFFLTQPLVWRFRLVDWWTVLFVLLCGTALAMLICALPGFVDSKNEEKTERNAGYLVVSQSGGGMLRQGTREGIRRTPANRGMRAHRIVKGLDISEDVCHGMCP